MKEFVRKKLVALKRNPTIIPMLMLCISFLVFSLNLTLMSNTTAKVQGTGMGLAQFATMLFSLLSLVCLLNSFPRRKKANVPMVVLMFLMLGIIVYCDLHYLGRINAAITREVSPIDVVTSPYVPAAANMLRAHIACICASGLLVALLPVYSKLLRKINTSVAVEENAGMHDIELSE